MDREQHEKFIKEFKEILEEIKLEHAKENDIRESANVIYFKRRKK
jgi:hypothetical protein